jgi:hypothetical protein
MVPCSEQVPLVPVPGIIEMTDEAVGRAVGDVRSRRIA